MRILDIALKDLTQILRDRRSLLFLVAMPIVFTFFMAFAYRAKPADPNADLRLVLAVVNDDQGAALSDHLIAQVEASGLVKTAVMDEAAAREAVRKGEVAGALLIPTDYSSGIQAGEERQLILLADSASTSGQSLYQVLRSPVTQLMSTVEIARLNVEILNTQTPLSVAEQSAESNAAFQSALQKWTESSNTGWVVTQTASPDSSAAFGGNPYNQSSPGMLVMFAIFGLVTSAQILVQERKTRTLERMLTTSLSPAAVVAGHFLAMFVLTMVQQVLLVLFGQFAYGVDYLRQPLGILLVMVALSFTTASIGLFIGAFARQEEQVILYAMVAMFTFSALGGVWFPLEGTGKAFATIGRLTPGSWAMEGFQNILLRGLDATSTLLPAGVLMLYALVFFALAAWRLKKVK
jgi:ABC-2 type transport system permease protein